MNNNNVFDVIDDYKIIDEIIEAKGAVQQTRSSRPRAIRPGEEHLHSHVWRLCLALSRGSVRG